MQEWIVVCGKYQGLESRAVDGLTAAMREYLPGEIPVFEADGVEPSFLKNRNVVFLGTPFDNAWLGAQYPNVANGNAQGYIVDVSETHGTNRIAIVGNTPQGVYYGTIDFLYEYLPTVPAQRMKNGNFNLHGVFDAPFQCVMPPFFIERAPAIERRAIWTWGHCIFDYRAFFEHMATLKLNEIVIWNDAMPINAAQVVEYAHTLGIRVVFGFAWGWDLNCEKFDVKKCFDEEQVRAFAQKALDYYRRLILPTQADGIYFQSFTETTAREIDGISIAEAVTAWVNGIAREFYDAYPQIELQFGLHATSVKKDLSALRSIDPRIKIVWEDCGAFPYHYSPAAIETAQETEAFTDTILSLRGENEKFGAVFKGMTTLYWDTFRHVEHPFVLGKSSKKTVDEVYYDRKRAWKYIEAKWLKNAEYVRKTTAQIAKNTHGETDIQLLVEYGAFEKEIFFPVALAAAILWNPNENTDVLIEKTALHPAVKFVNL